MLFKCKDCEKEISHSAGACPNCGCKKPFFKTQIARKEIKEWNGADIRAFTKSGGIIKYNTKPIKWFFGILVASFFGLYLIGANMEAKLTPEQRAERDRERAYAREQKESKEQAENERKEYEPSVMTAEFYSLSKCLEGLKKSSGQQLEIITDEPDKVSGLLSNGEGFACEKKTTGTKGTYYEGWYFKKGG